MSHEEQKRSEPQAVQASQTVRPAERGVAPGKQTRTMGLQVRPSGASAPVQRKPAADTADRGTGMTAQWLDTAMRPDLFPPPVQRKAAPGGTPVVQRLAEEPAAQAGAEPAEVHIPTREEVHANPQAYGIPPGGNPDDWFNEYVAHTLAYMGPEQLDINALDPTADDYQAQVAAIERHRATMSGWGYNPDSLTFLSDSSSGDNETGLQAVRIDPMDPDSGIGSVVGFRGTEPFAGHQGTLTNPLGALDDVAADLGRDIGGNQYRENQDRINALIAGGTGPVTLTGHSLGGALAQHAAAGSTSGNVANVVGFQAPGIDASSAQAFDQANADGHIGVRFHEHSNDVVHRAGQQKLGGTHNTWTDTNDPGIGGAHGSNFMYNGIGGDGQQVTNVGAGSSAEVTAHDPIVNRLGWEGGRGLIGGVGNVAASPFQGAFALGQGLGAAGVNAGQGLLDSGSSLVGGIAEGGSTMGQGLSQGASEMWDGEILSGLGTMAGGVGRGLGAMAGGVWEGATGVARTGAGVVGDVAGAVWDGVSTAGSHLVDGVGTTARAVGNLATWGFDAVTGLFTSDEEEQAGSQ